MTLTLSTPRGGTEPVPARNTLRNSTAYRHHSLDMDNQNGVVRDVVNGPPMTRVRVWNGDELVLDLNIGTRGFHMRVPSPDVDPESLDLNLATRTVLAPIGYGVRRQVTY